MNEEMKKITEDLKALLPGLTGMKADLEGFKKTPEEIAEVKKQVASLQGNVLEMGKRFSELTQQRTVLSSELNDEQKLDFVKFMIGVYKSTRAPSNENTAMIRSIQEKYGRKTMTEGTSTAGGLLVPTLFSKFIWRAALQKSVALQECTLMPLTSGWQLPLSRINADVAVTWENEEADNTSDVSSPTIATSTLTAKKMMGNVIVSNELLEDEPAGLIDDAGSTNIVDWLFNLFAEAMGAEIDNQAFNGTSTFTGILAATGTNLVTMDHGKGNFADVSGDNLSKMISALKVSQLMGAKYLLSPTMLHVVRTLKDSNGNYIWASMANGEPNSVWGYPYVSCEKMPALSATAVSTKFLIFGNLKKFVLGTKGEMTMVADKSIRLLTDQTYIVVRKRIAMLTAQPNAFVCLKTATTDT